MTNLPKIAALIVAGGTGSRLKSRLPKQYMQLGDKAVLAHSVQPFLDHALIEQVQIVIHPDHQLLYAEAMQWLELPAPVMGGDSRQQSVKNGLEALAQSPTPPDYVLIHDAARPFITREAISQLIHSLQQHQASLLAVPLHDTLKKVNEEMMVEHTIDRTQLYRAQTPQAFRFDTLLELHRNHAGQECTDDVSLMERANIPIHIVKGSAANFKITTMEDLVQARRYMNSTTTPTYIPVVGQGVDVHAFDATGTATYITLGGVEVPHDRALIGHSDADVLLHAITDAVLGCIADGDIGQHFSPKDPQWKDASSDLFLEHACTLARTQKLRITHVDATIISEEPKIGPHRDAMRHAVATIMGLSVEQISVKATTTEKLGFTGRGEGLMVQALVTGLKHA